MVNKKDLMNEFEQEFKKSNERKNSNLIDLKNNYISYDIYEDDNEIIKELKKKINSSKVTFSYIQKNYFNDHYGETYNFVYYLRKKNSNLTSDRILLWINIIKKRFKILD